MIDCNKIPLKDKGCHIIVGFAIALIVSFLFNEISALALVLFAGATKEAWDEYGYGGGDFFDFFATLVGGVAGIFTYGIINIFI